MTRTNTLAGFTLVALLLSCWSPSFVGAVDPTVRAVLAGEGAISYSSGFIRDGLPLYGTVNQVTGDSQITGNRVLLGARDKLYLTLKNPQETVAGDILTVYRQRHKVFHPTTGIYLGNLYSVRGLVEVIKLDGNQATARIIVSYDAISPGDGIMRFEPPPQANAAPGRPGGTGMIVDIQPPRSLTAQRHIVYVDWGREEGLEPGAQLEVYRVGGGLPQRELGELHVVAVEDHTASTLIVKSVAPFVRGDRFAVKEPAPATSQGPASMQPDKVAKLTPPPSPADIELQREGGRLTINLDQLVDQLEYESGEATVSPAGKEILGQLFALLKEMPPHRITVEGHADNMPIGPSLRQQFPTNLELSKARADAVVRYLLEQGGLDPGNITAVGVSDKKPVASNATEAGRRKNRRIEVILTPLESGADLPAVQPAPLAPAP